jgi:hypothetical protein
MAIANGNAASVVCTTVMIIISPACSLLRKRRQRSKLSLCCTCSNKMTGIRLVYWLVIAVSSAARVVVLELLQRDFDHTINFAYQVNVNTAQEWSDDMLVCTWSEFTSTIATPFEISVPTPAVCNSKPANTVVLPALHAGSYVIKAAVVRRGAVSLNASSVLSDFARLQVSISTSMAIDSSFVDCRVDARMQRLHRSLHQMHGALILPDVQGGQHVRGFDQSLREVLLDDAENPYKIRTNVHLQPLLDACNVSVCTAQLTALRRHHHWVSVSTNSCCSIPGLRRALMLRFCALSLCLLNSAINMLSVTCSHLETT